MTLSKTNKIMISVAVLLLGGYFAASAYTKRWIRFSDNVWTGVILGDHDSPLAGYVGFILSGDHGIKVGDMVEVEQDPGATNTYYNGLAEVVFVDGSVVSIDKTFGHSTQPEGGRIRKA